jgi:hypothetical protein
MYKVTLNTEVGSLSFKAKRTPAHDKVVELPWTMFESFPKLLKRKDWAKSMANIIEYIGIKDNLVITKLDGRSQEAKELDWFNWRRVFSYWLEYGSFIVCSACGKVEDPSNWANEKDMRARHFCFNCNFWQDQLDLDHSGEREFAVIDGCHYVIAPDTCGHFKGMGGALHKIEFNDGRVVVTRNLWCQGEIPEKWKCEFPNNAKFVQIV